MLCDLRRNLGSSLAPGCIEDDLKRSRGVDVVNLHHHFAFVARRWRGLIGLPAMNRMPLKTELLPKFCLS